MGIVGSILFYIITFFISTLFAWFLSLTYSKIKFVGPYAGAAMKVSRGLLFLLTCAPLSIMFTFRDGVGVDYESYKSLYYFYVSTGADLNSIVRSGEEVAYGIINILGYELFDSYQGTLFLVSLLIVIPVLKSLLIFDPERITIGWLWYLLTLFPSSFNGMRQHIAVAFCFLAIALAYKRKSLWAVLSILAGSLFHKSCVFTFIFFILLRISKKNAYKRFLWLMPLVVLADIGGAYALSLLSNIPLVSIYFLKYADTAGVVTTMHFFAHSIFKLPLTFILLWYAKPLIRQNPRNFALILYTFFDYAFIAASYTIRWAIRMQYYTMIAAPFIVMAFLITDKEKLLNRKALAALLIVAEIIQFVCIFGYSGYDGIMPYSFSF